MTELDAQFDVVGDAGQLPDAFFDALAALLLSVAPTQERDAQPITANVEED